MLNFCYKIKGKKLDLKGITQVLSDISIESIKEVNLYATQIGDEGVAHLTERLPANILSLSLPFNGIGSTGGEAIGKNLQDKNVIFLSVASNNLGDEGMIAISQQCANTKIKSLDLRDNNIRGEKILDFLLNLENANVAEIDLRFNNIDDNAAREIARFVVGKKFTSCRLAGNPISADNLTRIQKAIFTNIYDWGRSLFFLAKGFNLPDEILARIVSHVVDDKDHQVIFCRGWDACRKLR